MDSKETRLRMGWDSSICADLCSSTKRRKCRCFLTYNLKEGKKLSFLFFFVLSCFVSSALSPPEVTNSGTSRGQASMWEAKPWAGIRSAWGTQVPPSLGISCRREGSPALPDQPVLQGDPELCDISPFLNFSSQFKVVKKTTGWAVACNLKSMRSPPSKMRADRFPRKGGRAEGEHKRYFPKVLEHSCCHKALGMGADKAGGAPARTQEAGFQGSPGPTQSTHQDGGRGSSGHWPLLFTPFVSTSFHYLLCCLNRSHMLQTWGIQFSGRQRT